MAAPRTQKHSPANAGRTAAKRGSTSRASSSHTSRSGRSTASSRTRSAAGAAARTRRAQPGRAARPAGTSSGKRRPRSSGSSGQARITALMVIAAIVLAAWWVYPTFRLQYEHQREVKTLEGELEELKSRNDELRDDVEELKTPEGVEQLARESLGLVKPGEQAYVVTGSVASETTATASGAEGPEFWEQALNALFGLE